MLCSVACGRLCLISISASHAWHGSGNFSPNSHFTLHVDSSVTAFVFRHMPSRRTSADFLCKYSYHYSPHQLPATSPSTSFNHAALLHCNCHKYIVVPRYCYRTFSSSPKHHESHITASTHSHQKLSPLAELTARNMPDSSTTTKCTKYVLKDFYFSGSSQF